MIISTLLLLLPQTGDLEAALQTARQKAENGDFQGAVSALESANASSSRNCEALTALGVFKLRNAEVQISSGQLRGLAINDAFLDAAEVLEQASQLPGSTSVAFENWSEALLNGGDRKNALRAATQGVASYPKTGTIYAQRARIHVAVAQNSSVMTTKLDGFSAAIEDLKAAVKFDKTSAIFCTKLGETLILEAFAKEKKGDPSKARKSAAKLWASAIKRNKAAVDLSAMCQWLGSEAVPLLEKLDKSQGKDATMAWYKGFAEYSTTPANWKEVRKHFEKSLELSPGMSNSYYFLADGAFKEGRRIQDSGEDAARATKAYRYSANAWAKYLASNGPAHSAGTLNSPDGGAATIATMKWLAGVAVNHRDVESAIEINAWISKTTPNDVEAWNNLGVMYRDSGQAALSLPAYAKAAELSPEDPQVLNDWAVIYHYYLKTEDEKARDLYQQAIDLANSILSNQSGLSDEAKQRIRIALRDATNNLAKLKNGNRRNG